MATVGTPTVDMEGIIAVKISDASIAVGKILQGDTTNTTNSSIVCKAATDSIQKPLGVTTTATDAANEIATMQYSGIVKINCDGSSNAIDIGDMIVATTAGQGIIAPTLDSTERWTIGYALAPCAADGDMIPVMIDRSLIGEPDQA
jgi:hypothetical protein